MSPTAVLAAAAAPSALPALPALALVRRRHVDLLLHASARCRRSPRQR